MKPHFSAAKRAGDFVFLSGQLPFDGDGSIVAGGIEAQTRQCLENLQKVLLEEKLGLGDVVKVNVWLIDGADFPAFNRVYAEYFPEAPPARSTVASQLMVAGARIEMEAQAFDSATYRGHGRAYNE